jgi:hypothetical protein
LSAFEKLQPTSSAMVASKGNYARSESLEQKERRESPEKRPATIKRSEALILCDTLAWIPVSPPIPKLPSHASDVITLNIPQYLSWDKDVVLHCKQKLKVASAKTRILNEKPLSSKPISDASLKTLNTVEEFKVAQESAPSGIMKQLAVYSYVLLRDSRCNLVSDFTYRN